MNLFAQVRRNLRFGNRLWQNRAGIRALIESENYVFVRDFRPGHFYSPLPALADVRARTKRRVEPSPEALPAVQLNAERQIELLGSLSQTYHQVPFPTTPSPDHRYYFDNPFFSYGDGIILYSLLRRFRPQRVIEIGSGFSSAAMLDTDDQFLDHQVKFTFIEPYPERLLTLLSPDDRQTCRMDIKPVQDVDLTLFDSLRDRDFLFVDSSHVAKMGSDVLHILFEILPRLKPGVIVHFHDILWPFEYPAIWLENGRAWNEAYFLRAFLQYNPAFEILYFNSYMALHHADKIRSTMPRVLQTPSTPETMGNSSLWLRKTS